MPLFLNKKTKNHHLLVWKVEESLEKLIHLSNNKNTEHLHSYKRKKEFLVVRILLNIYNKNLKISYSKYGSPQLDNNQFVSISHSIEFVVIILSNKKIGVDIEKISKKTQNILPKFSNKKHLTIEESTLVWCIKEAVFKFYEKGNIDFIKDIEIPELNIYKKNIKIKLKSKELKATFFKLEDYFLAYVCN